MDVSKNKLTRQSLPTPPVNQVQIYESASKLLLAGSLESTYQVVVDEAMRLVGGKYGSIFIPKGDELVRIYASDPILRAVKPRKQGNTYETFRTNRPYLLPSSAVESIHEDFKKLKAGSDISIPLGNKGMTVGVLSVLSPRDRIFTQDDLVTLMGYGSLASLAINSAQHVELLEEAVTSRDLFISMAAHELRTPLTAIVTYTHLLSRKIRPDNLEANDHARRLITAISRLNTLVNELLQIDKVKEGLLSYEMRPLWVEPVIDKSIEEFSHTWPNRTVEKHLRLGKKAEIWADEGKLAQVFNNLLHNAHKFSPINTPIKVRAFRYLNRYVIEVADQGIGMDKKDQEGVFGQYFRGNSNKEGMGLGLFLTKAIVDKHGGIISLKSKLNQGTLVRVELPVRVKNEGNNRA